MLKLKLISSLGIFLVSCFSVSLPTASAESSPSSLFDKFYGDLLYTNGQEAWITFDAEYWEDIVGVGSWNVTASLSGYEGTTSFEVTSSPTVTPEPISATLFLTGGAALFLRKRKKGSGF